MSGQTLLLLEAAVAIVGLILLITRWRIHPFVALTLASGFLGLTSGMGVDKVMKSYQDGFGGVLGFVGVVPALGTMLGKMMAESGGADRIARTLVDAFGRERVHWAMMFAAFLVGIPLFFEIGFVLLIPLVFIVANAAGQVWAWRRCGDLRDPPGFLRECPFARRRHFCQAVARGGPGLRRSP